MSSPQSHGGGISISSPQSHGGGINISSPQSHGGGISISSSQSHGGGIKYLVSSPLHPGSSLVAHTQVDLILKHVHLYLHTTSLK